MVVTGRCYPLVVALCLVVSAHAQSQTSNNYQREPQAIDANVAFLQEQGLSLGEAQLLADSAATPGAEIPILEDVKDGPWHDGSYYFRYTSADGSQREEGGIPTAPCTLRVTGSYSYLAPNGELVDMQYVADETGYKAFPSGTRPDLYTAPVRVPEPIFPVGYFDGIPCPGDEFNNQGDQIASGTTLGRPTTANRPRPGAGSGPGNTRPLRPVQPPVRPGAGAGRPAVGGTPSRPVGGQRPITQGRPSTGIRPTTGSLGRPTSGAQGRPNNGGQGRPTPSNQVRPSYGPRPTSQRPVTPGQGGFGQRRPTPAAGFKTPTSFINAVPTNINTQNNYNNGGNKDGYSYKEPSRTFNYNQQNNENTVTTDFPAGPQTTPIEPLTGLYDTPNF